MLTITVHPGENALQNAINQLPAGDEPVTLHLMPGEYRKR